MVVLKPRLKPLRLKSRQLRKLRVVVVACREVIMLIDLHVSEINAAIALFSGVAEKIREQAIAQSTPPAPMPDPSIPDNAEIVPVEPK